MVSDLTSMKSSGKLAPEQTKQVDTLLPKATSLTSELEKPQVEAAKLPQLASDLSDLQKQVGRSPRSGPFVRVSTADTRAPDPRRAQAIRPRSIRRPRGR